MLPVKVLFAILKTLTLVQFENHSNGMLPLRWRLFPTLNSSISWILEKDGGKPPESMFQDKVH
jgi:hypothetical protein